MALPGSFPRSAPGVRLLVVTGTLILTLSHHLTLSQDCSTFPQPCGFSEFSLKDCWVTENTTRECDMQSPVSETWPGPPEDLTATIYYTSVNGPTLQPGIKFTWRPHLYSFSNLQAFKLTAINYRTGAQSCRMFNFRPGLWVDGPIRTTLDAQRLKMKFSYNCLLMAIPQDLGTVGLYLTSRPMSALNRSLNTKSVEVTVRRPTPTTPSPSTSGITNIVHTEEETPSGRVNLRIRFSKQWSSEKVSQYRIQLRQKLGETLFVNNCQVNRTQTEATCLLENVCPQKNVRLLPSCITLESGKAYNACVLEVQPVPNYPSCVCGKLTFTCEHCLATPTAYFNITQHGSNCHGYPTMGTKMLTSDGASPPSAIRETKSAPDAGLTTEQLLGLVIGIFGGIALIALALFFMIRPSARSRVKAVICKTCKPHHYKPPSGPPNVEVTGDTNRTPEIIGDQQGNTDVSLDNVDAVGNPPARGEPCQVDSGVEVDIPGQQQFTGFWDGQPSYAARLESCPHGDFIIQPPATIPDWSPSEFNRNDDGSGWSVDGSI